MPNLTAHLGEDVPELKVDPAHGEDRAMDETGIPRQTGQYGLHVVSAQGIIV
jgi:hypothetical protein